MILVFAENFEKIPKNILEIRPNVIISIPHLWEKIYDTTKSIVSRQNKTTSQFSIGNEAG